MIFMSNPQHFTKLGRIPKSVTGPVPVPSLLSRNVFLLDGDRTEGERPFLLNVDETSRKNKRGNRGLHMKLGPNLRQGGVVPDRESSD